MKSFNRSTRNQYFAVISVNIITISAGSLFGWTSSSFLTLQSDESPLETGPMTNSELEWVASILVIGSLFGNIFFFWLSDVIGRKRCLQLIAVPALIGWLIIPLATKPIHLYVSRFIGGFSVGGTLSVVSVFVTEIAEDHIRGELGSYMILFSNFGTLLANILGFYYRYDVVAIILAPLSVLFLCLFSFMLETPTFFLKKNKTEAAEKSLRFYRNISSKQDSLPEVLHCELEECKKDLEKSSQNAFLSWNDFNDRIVRKAIFIGTSLMTLSTFSGCATMIGYSGMIFQESGSDFSPEACTIAIGIAQLLGSCVSVLLVERVGRKILLIASSIATGLGQLILGTYINLKFMGYNLANFNWIPVVSFSFAILAASCGYLSVKYLVIAELMPPRIRVQGCMFCSIFLWSFTFINSRFLLQISDIIGLDNLMYFYVGCSFTIALFVALVLPETRGKSFEEIMKLL